MILTMKCISFGFDVDAESARHEDSSDKATPGAKDPKPLRRDGNRNTLPGVLAFMGYAFCPGNAVFGPWVKFEDYRSMFRSRVWVRRPEHVESLEYLPKGVSSLVSLQNLGWFGKISYALAIGLANLTVSTCWSSWLIPEGLSM